MSSNYQGLRVQITPYGQWVKEWHNGEELVTLRKIHCQGSKAWAISEAGFVHYDGKAWVTWSLPFAGAPDDLLVRRDGNLWVAGRGRLWRWIDGNWQQEGDAPRILSWAETSDGVLWAIGEGRLWRRVAAWEEAGPVVPQGVEVRRVTAWNDRVAVATNWGLWFVEGKRTYLKPLFEGFTKLPTNDIRDACFDAWGHLWLATNQGVLIVAGGDGFLHLIGKDGLPVEDLEKLAVGADGSVWVGSKRGAACLKGGRWHYFASHRWLPSDLVTAIGVMDDGRTIIGTDKGIGLLFQTPMTLEQKAHIFSQQLQDRHRRFGYVASRELAEPGNLKTGRVHISDNDGLWTALYAAAELFRYRTMIREGREEKSRQALDSAIESLQAILFLEKVTGISGFPARAVRHKSEPEYGVAHREWHPSADGEWEWKGDTSSDEIVGHFFIYWVAYETLPEGTLKKEIVQVARRMMDHIIDNGWYLIDIDGKPTTWGVWAPEKLNHDEIWWGDRGLNALQVLAFLKATYRMTGDDKYEHLYRRLIQENHYALNTVKQKIIYYGRTNHSDDQLAFLSYYVLLRAEDDAHLRRLFVTSLRRTWELEKKERCPLWNFIYGAVTGEDCAAEEAVQTLQAIPLDLIYWNVYNSHRSDICRRQDCGLFAETEAVDPLPFTERPLHKWNGNPYRLDGGSEGRAEEEPTFFLLPYWMARYYQIIMEDSSGGSG
ncbi:MAG: hypothetical protein NZ959_11975 [Armatimonadetes bacterium]|nr:hypothetical protein [Armatimonadota bacterium]MDW8122587.1 hypothetical protein [Armatimonadota bacterium]